MISFFNALQYARDNNMRLGLEEGSWMMDTLTSLFMVQGENKEWKSHMEEALCIKLLSAEELNGIDHMDAISELQYRRWNRSKWE